MYYYGLKINWDFKKKIQLQILFIIKLESIMCVESEKIYLEAILKMITVHSPFFTGFMF
jgi:hypothetical protein